MTGRGPGGAASLTLRMRAPGRRCLFVGLNPHCAEDVHRIDYLSAFYCQPWLLRRLLVTLGLLLLLVLLFFVMSTVAEAFLCPAIQVGLPDHEKGGWLVHC